MFPFRQSNDINNKKVLLFAMEMRYTIGVIERMCVRKENNYQNNQ